jgi:shikimate dehydrogenase
MSRRAAVLGAPIAHSLSPALHRAAYRALGLDGWTYTAVELDEAGLGPWFAGLGPEWIGLSVTRPLKRAVLGLADHVDPLATTVGGANTVLFTEAGSVAANTDVHGMVAAVEEVTGGAAPGTVSILGGGATAASALAAAAELGVTRPVVHARSMARSRPVLEAAARMGLTPELHRLGDGGDDRWTADLVISTLPAHAADPLAAGLASWPDPVEGEPGTGHVLLDAAYDPWPSALAIAWERAGGTVVSGKSMLLHQAAEQVRLMTGRPAPLEEMRAAL